MKTNEELKSTPNLLIIRTGIDGGMGEMYRCGKRFGSVIWSNGCGWEHVSVHPYKNRYTPCWEDMCALKDMFFYDDEVVVEYHPAKSEYVNNLSNCLHLWRPTDEVMPTPPSIMVGVKDGQSAEDVKKAIDDLEKNAQENQKSKKPIQYDKYYYKCPCCGKDLGLDADDIYLFDMDVPNFCCECGQKLDWGK